MAVSVLVPKNGTMRQTLSFNKEKEMALKESRHNSGLKAKGVLSAIKFNLYMLCDSLLKTLYVFKKYFI